MSLTNSATLWKAGTRTKIWLSCQTTVLFTSILTINIEHKRKYKFKIMMSLKKTTYDNGKWTICCKFFFFKFAYFLLSCRYWWSHSHFLTFWKKGKDEAGINFNWFVRCLRMCNESETILLWKNFYRKCHFYNSLFTFVKRTPYDKRK